MIGILVDEFEPFSAETPQGRSRRDLGHRATSSSPTPRGDHGSRPGWERRSLSRLAGTLIDGAIMVTPTVVDSGSAVPVVAIDPHTGPAGMPTVDSDNLAGAVLATEHLLGLGHRRIALLGGRPDLESARLRERDSARPWPPPASPSTRAGARRRLPAADGARAGPRAADPAERPTAVFAANDLSAIATLEAAPRWASASRRTCRWSGSTTCPSRRSPSRPDHGQPADAADGRRGRDPAAPPDRRDRRPAARTCSCRPSWSAAVRARQL